MKYYCPVCGYDGLTKPPADYSICACCGTEFGYDDIAHSWTELRDRWLSGGAVWFSQHTPQPHGWNPVLQLIEAGWFIQDVRAGTSRVDIPVSEFAPPVWIEKVVTN